MKKQQNENEYITGILYQAGDSLFRVMRDADEGWVYTVFEKDDASGAFDTPRGGYLPGRFEATADQVACAVAELIGADAAAVKQAAIPMGEFNELVSPNPAFVHRGVKVFYDPILRSGTAGSVPDKVVAGIKRLIDDRLALSILLKRDKRTGRYSMSLIPAIIAYRFSSDEPSVMVKRPDGSEGRLIIDASAYASGFKFDYDVSWALGLWLEPVFVDWTTDGLSID